jgi:hypothetical protein
MTLAFLLAGVGRPAHAGADFEYCLSLHGRSWIVGPRLR